MPKLRGAGQGGHGKQPRSATGPSARGRPQGASAGSLLSPGRHSPPPAPHRHHPTPQSGRLLHGGVPRLSLLAEDAAGIGQQGVGQALGLGECLVLGGAVAADAEDGSTCAGGRGRTHHLGHPRRSEAPAGAQTQGPGAARRRTAQLDRRGAPREDPPPPVQTGPAARRLIVSWAAQQQPPRSHPPASVNALYSSRNLQASFVQPGVAALRHASPPHVSSGCRRQAAAYQAEGHAHTTPLHATPLLRQTGPAGPPAGWLALLGPRAACGTTDPVSLPDRPRAASLTWGKRTAPRTAGHSGQREGQGWGAARVVAWEKPGWLQVQALASTGQRRPTPAGGGAVTCLPLYWASV